MGNEAMRSKAVSKKIAGSQPRTVANVRQVIEADVSLKYRIISDIIKPVTKTIYAKLFH